MSRGVARSGSASGKRVHGAELAKQSSGGLRSPWQVMLAVALIGIAATASVSWTAWRTDRSTEQRLLQEQTKQAAIVIAASIIGIESPLRTSLDTAAATAGQPAQFARFMAANIGPGHLFVTASLWQTAGGAPKQLTSTGISADLIPSSAAARAFIAHASQSKTFVVTSLSSGGLQRVGYALADPANTSYVVYAERAIPANRRVSVESSSAFSELHFATYLGRATTAAALQTTDIAPDRLPLTGRISRQQIPFGDMEITLVAAAVGHLGGEFTALLWWVFLAGGLALTLAATFIAGQLVRRQLAAERDSQTISGLYDELDELYSEQRTIADALQHALLPQSHPSIPALEIASRYVAGARGIDIGGDWYSFIRIDDNNFGFVVGDVSGRGVGAAALMARIRFTLRAYLMEGHPPEVALQMCARQVDISQDKHFATVLIGVGDLTSRTIRLASAGHLRPLIVSESGAVFASTQIGPPIGITTITETPYSASTIAMPPGSMLLAFTDGLIERRDEDIELGMQRLAAAASPSDEPLDAQLTTLLSIVTHDESEDDIAILAFKWVAAERAVTRLSNAGAGLDG